MNPISLKFMIEKREGHGEDSPPLSIVKDEFYAVGVFDGMGGSGAAICKSEFGDDHTKAYVASRIILEAINNYIENTSDVRCINSDGIRFTARGRLEQEKSSYPTKASGLRSKLVRDYPTTLAITTALKNEDESYVVNSYWAGDSRNYLWTEEGFYQISKDDLDTELDPLENLRNDGALSNCICADREFYINNKTIQVPGKFVILSASDGCFNYFATPMHFQEVLLTGLRLSENVDDWETFCKKEFSAVTGDDVSISLLAIGFESFTDLKDTFMSLIVTGIKEIKSAQDEIKRLTSELDSAKADLEALIQSEWEAYKVSYMKYFSVETESVSEDSVVVASEESSSVSSTNGNDVIPTKDETCNDESAEIDEKSNSSEKDNAEKPQEDSLIEEKDNIIADGVVCESDTESSEIEVSEIDKLSLDKEETTKIITEADVVHSEAKSIEEKTGTEKSTAEKPQKESPKFGRIEVKTAHSNTLRTRYSNPSKSDVDRMINQFISNPSYETAYALMDLMLDFGESVMPNIPQTIRIELKKFKR